MLLGPDLRFFLSNAAVLVVLFVVSAIAVWTAREGR